MSYITNQWVKMNPFEAANRLTELERENAALRADKERLDWLDTNCVFIAVEGHCDKRLINARHTIDAARKEKQ